MNSALQCCLPSEGSGYPDLDDDVIVRHPVFTESVDKSERDDLVVTVKLFPSDFDDVRLEDALVTALQELNVSHVDNAILSFPFHSEAGSSLNSMKSLWKKLETMQKQGLVTNLGVSDLDKPELEVLYDAAEVKPFLNQINVASCCIIPKDLLSYTKSNDIKLAITSDPRVLLTQHKLNEVLSVGKLVSGLWKPLWTLRYKSMTKYTGVIKHRGYLTKCVKEG